MRLDSPLFAQSTVEFASPLSWPAWAVLVPRLRFLRDRVTPGELGIELTTALAVAVVGLYVFSAYALELDDGPERLTPADRETLEWSEDLWGDAGIEVIES